MAVKTDADDLTGFETVIERTFDAPRALVWRAWTDPEHVRQWWGPKGFDSACCEIELRVGSIFRLQMRAPDGNSYPCRGVFREIVAPERIVYDSTADDSHACGAGLPPRSRVTITFSECNNQTTLTLHTRFISAARRDAADRAGFSSSWSQCLGAFA
ncbi:MAG: SRPBCC family protein [Gammaproteobacteria bacterium]